ncbi:MULTISPECIES: efflux RND transporter periplasmic adaptor subunit [unclassified Sphingomonas]|jgi:cobalt-zinc-cadmium efflux system membrane fusion protein|uniref:efflux RND transporter periplasmic adaptor subunit n=1 Tax=unclassified Sphingomonas TaxID=196159 RepID=UPI002150A8D6|nr:MULTISPECIES: efflux RND transporter periplasmic adaptor subunit [unclassified Sphingomonas]MCR5870048.1 efflux RND transporter periplasmic adaptor subunit [Sphingomonas sp. J344]UUX98258.1 efflux RND transporter periplasmic adaptor subunit [Sphingomonas sp. J315]
MKNFRRRALASALLPLVLAACGGAPENKAGEAAEMEGMEKGEAGENAEKDVVTLTPRQIADAGIEVASPTVGGIAGTIEVPGLIEGDPQGVQVVSATIGGRVVSLTRNLGQPVRHGDALAIIESREAASLRAEVEAARARAALAQSNLRREQRLFAERVSPEQDLIAARTAATEANIALRLAQQQLAATGGGAGALNRIAMRSPISGQVIARPAVLGQTVDANAELYRVADLSRITVAMSLQPADAGRVRPGTRVEITAAGRRQQGSVTFVSPVLDETTRLVRVIATLDNAQGVWRVGEPVTAAIILPSNGASGIAVPSTAIQTVENRTVVFVRTASGFRAVPVTIGRPDGDQVVVTSGLTGRERIATTNSFTLKAELGKGGEMDMD